MSAMSPEVSRRAALLALAGTSVAVVARAQAPTSPSPPVLAPNAPPVIAPAPQPASPTPGGAAPPRPPPLALAGVDRTKAYYLFFDQTIDAASSRRLRQQFANLVEGGVS